MNTLRDRYIVKIEEKADAFAAALYANSVWAPNDFKDTKLDFVWKVNGGIETTEPFLPSSESFIELLTFENGFLFSRDFKNNPNQLATIDFSYENVDETKAAKVGINQVVINVESEAPICFVAFNNNVLYDNELSEETELSFTQRVEIKKGQNIFKIEAYNTPVKIFSDLLVLDTEISE